MQIASAQPSLPQVLAGLEAEGTQVREISWSGGRWLPSHNTPFFSGSKTSLYWGREQRKEGKVSILWGVCYLGFSLCFTELALTAVIPQRSWLPSFPPWELLCASWCAVLLHFSRPCTLRLEMFYFYVLFFLMIYLCEKYCKPITVQYYIADCVSWVPRVTSLDLQIGLLWTCSWNGTHSYVADIWILHRKYLFPSLLHYTLTSPQGKQSLNPIVGDSTLLVFFILRLELKGKPIYGASCSWEERW